MMSVSDIKQLTTFFLLLALNISDKLVDCLQCYSCQANLEVRNDTCRYRVEEAKVETCRATDTFCLVYKQIWNTPGMGKFERGCAKQCEEECHSFGEGVSKCRSCCRTDLCNIGDTSSTVFHATTVTTVMLATLCIIYIVT